MGGGVWAPRVMQAPIDMSPVPFLSLLPHNQRKNRRHEASHPASPCPDDEARGDVSAARQGEAGEEATETGPASISAGPAFTHCQLFIVKPIQSHRVPSRSKSLMTRGRGPSGREPCPPARPQFRHRSSRPHGRARGLLVRPLMELTGSAAFGRLAFIFRDAGFYSEAVTLFTDLPVTQT